MHGFALAMGSVMGHAWCKDVITAGQRVVTHFRASPNCSALLYKMAAERSIKTGLVSSNTTRITSVYLCLLSLLLLERPLIRFVREDEEKDRASRLLAPTKGQDHLVVAVVKQPGFFDKVRPLTDVLAPFNTVITDVQSRDSTLGDMTLVWLYLARHLAIVLGKYSERPDLLPLGKLRGR